MKNCPLCNKDLVKGPAGEGNVIYCPEEILLKGNRIRNHYIEDHELTNTITYYLLPYRIITIMNKCVSPRSLISIEARYKTGKKGHYFKTIVKCPVIHPDTEERLRNRIKNLLILS